MTINKEKNRIFDMCKNFISVKRLMRKKLYPKLMKFIQITFILIIFVLLTASTCLAQQDKNEQEPVKEEQVSEKKGFFDFLKRKDKTSGKDTTQVSKSGRKKKFSLRQLNPFRKKKDKVHVQEEKKWPTGQDLTPEESDKVERLMEKYKLTPDEQQVIFMYESGEPLSRKGMRTLKKARRKQSKRIEKIRKFHIKRNLNIQDKKVKKRMKKNRRKSNRRIRKRIR